YQPSGCRTWPGLPGYVRRAHGPGWALVGDAGYFKDPISSHGITDALRDAELLARAVLAEWDADLDEPLAAYADERDRLSLALFRTVDRIAAHDWSAPEIAGLLRDLSAATTAEVALLAALDG